MKSKVAVVKTNPNTVLEDIGKAMHLANFKSFLPQDKDTLIKSNISWHKYFPACSTTPWQYDGVVKTFIENGYDIKKIIPVYNRSSDINAKLGIKNNRLDAVDKKYGLEQVHLYEPPIKWVEYQPKGKMRILNDIFPDGIRIPEFFIGKNIIHLPTIKTHMFTTITGAMKNAFNGLIRERGSFLPRNVINEMLVDLLAIQKEIHTGLFAVMDGTIVGSGRGPRAINPSVQNYILASADQVAIDAVSAKMQGFDPLSIPFIRIAHQEGLGMGDKRGIEIVGENISKVNFQHTKGMQILSNHNRSSLIKPLEGLLLHSSLSSFSFLILRLFHDFCWYPLVGKPRVNKILKSDWGHLFHSYRFESR